MSKLGIAATQLSQYLWGIIATAIIYEDNLIDALPIQGRPDLFRQSGYILRLIKNRNYN
jgi:hypothetical protein